MNMDPNSNELKGRLLAQFEPDRDRLARYRKEVEAMLEQQERSLDRQKWYAGVYWVYAVVLAAVFLVLGAERAGAPVWFWTTAMGLVLLIGGAVEMVKYVVNRARLELLREIKALELQVREMRETGGG
jgi:hypothetical protein